MQRLYRNLACLTLGCVTFLLTSLAFAGPPIGVTPEPTTLSLLAIGAAALGAGYKLRKRK